MKINLKEIESVVSLEPFKRYQYFIKKVADNELMYTLEDKNNNIATSKIGENILLPLWTAIEFAELCKVNGWDDYIIKPITLKYFENEFIDFISNESYLLNIFPVYDKSGFVVKLEEFTRDLSYELKKYD